MWTPLQIGRSRVERGGAGSLDVCLLAHCEDQSPVSTLHAIYCFNAAHEHTMGKEDEYAPLLKGLVPEAEAGLGPMCSRVSRSMKEGNNSVTFKT